METHGEGLNRACALQQYTTPTASVRVCGVIAYNTRLQCLGALDVGYGSNTSCIGVSDIEFEKNRIVCATHKTIKVYEVKEDSCGIHPPKFTLSLSYGDVEALTVCENILLSSCQDMSIQKWDLDRRSIEYNVNQAHNDVVSSLNVLPDRNTFITGCKSGYLKLWTLDRCNCYEEIKAHNSSVNSISYNSNFIFTASSDNTIGVWTMRSGRTWT
ncbi:kinesin-like protein KIF21A [Trichonephila clavipes]|uniref:Kinesin-like protein KIF21A n=1 Tax=Trichonephila clavipes TaxID=2585209 RepID=A0A8X6VNV6_TRICX|nr:kinesin-like protein KIF21A [Trichonephila clavipes]